ncbi:MAG: class I SAM-dependent methyltransferase [Candidatus Cloacimonetes bacterium]|nr:class I SAM-dependent methyltransferase [Candidatus Cloacimonadota bacterium]
MKNIKELYKYELARFEVQKKNLRRLWNIPQETAELLYTLVLTKSPKHILEIGTSNGFSTFWLSIAAESCDAVVDTIEVDKDRFKLAKRNLKNRKNIIQRFGKAELIIPELIDKYDFVFIDAGKINYIDYIKILINKLNNNAVIVADNVISHYDTVKEYLDYIKSSERFDSVTLNIDSGLNIAVYKTDIIKIKE